METLEPLSHFFRAINADYRISVTHIAIYSALLYFWADSGFISPIRAYRSDIMALAKIRSPYTYHKCMNELNAYGYLRYIATRQKNKKSSIYLFAETALQVPENRT